MANPTRCGHAGARPHGDHQQRDHQEVDPGAPVEDRPQREVQPDQRDEDDGERVVVRARGSSRLAAAGGVAAGRRAPPGPGHGREPAESSSGIRASVRGAGEVLPCRARQRIALRASRLSAAVITRWTNRGDPRSPDALDPLRVALRRAGSSPASTSAGRTAGRTRYERDQPVVLRVPGCRADQDAARNTPPSPEVTIGVPSRSLLRNGTPRSSSR
jgi:hypothetical protein